MEKLTHLSNISVLDYDNLNRRVCTTIEGHKFYVLNQEVKLYGITHFPMPQFYEQIEFMYRNQKLWRKGYIRNDDYGLITIETKGVLRQIQPGLRILYNSQIYSIIKSTPFINRGSIYGLNKI